MIEFKKLSDKQINTTISHGLLGKKKWYDKKSHMINIFNGWTNIGTRIDEGNLEEFITGVQKEKKRRQQEFFKASQEGKIQSKFTPSDKRTGSYDKVTEPKIGDKYHVSWAFKAAVFKLKKIEGNYAFLDNPKYKRKELLKVKLEDLRHLAKHRHVSER